MKNKLNFSKNIKENWFPSLDTLVYKIGDQWNDFPEWALFYLELGVALADYESESNKFVTAITVPIRSFAASLLASGIIVSRICLPGDTDENHINKLASLSEGTPVKFRRGNKEFKGVFIRTMGDGEKLYFQIRYEKSSEIFIPIDFANKIEVINRDEINIPKQQSGKVIDPPSPLLQNIFSKEKLNIFTSESKLECLIIGQIKTIRQELCETAIGCSIDTDSVAEGKLQDLVRAEGNHFQSGNMTYRTRVFSSSKSYSTQATAKISNYVTVFDNPLGFIKWRSFFLRSNWIVILDRTDRNFESVIKAINDEYIQNRIEKKSRISLPNPPAGVELMFFEVNR